MAVDELYIGQNVQEFIESPSFLPYGKVVLDVGTDDIGNTVSYFAQVQNYSPSTHRTFYCECWWGTQTMANNILSKLSGYVYKPYEANGALIDMSAELGDAVTVDGVYSAINYRSFHLDTLSSNDLSSPQDEEIDHEYPYDSVKDRDIQRNEAKTKAELNVMNDEIQLKVSASEAQSMIDVTLSEITLSVSSGENGSTISLTSNGVTVTSSAVDLHVKSVNVDGTITADAINLNTATITGQLTASNIDATNLHVSGANIDNLTVTNAQIQSLDADKITVNGKSIGANSSSGYLTSLYSNGAYIKDLRLPTSGSSQLNIAIGATGVSQDGGTTYTSWSSICSGGSGTAKWG